MYCEMTIRTIAETFLDLAEGRNPSMVLYCKLNQNQTKQTLTTLTTTKHAMRGLWAINYALKHQSAILIFLYRLDRIYSNPQ